VAGLVMAAVKKWEFAPAIRDGVAVATKVDLPVRIIDESAEANYAAN
jgi:hypothetical protein